MNKVNRLSYRDEMRRIYRSEGIFGFTRGYSAMVLRDAPGFGAYFFLYDLIKRSFGLSHFEHENNSFHWNVMMRKFFAGGIAGMMTWFLCYPMDTIKTTL